MNVAVKIFKRFAAMADHRPREGLERFRRDLDRAGGEKLVVRDHGKRSTVRAGLANRSTFNGLKCRRLASATDALQSFLDKAYVAAALDTGLLYFRDIVVVQTEAHVLFDIVRGDMVAVHGSKNEIAIFDDYFRQTFDEATEPMRVKGNEGQKPMQKHQDQPAAECRKKCGAAVDRAREHGRQNNQQNGVECGLARKRAFMAEPDHDQGGNKYDNTAQRDLDEGQIFRLRA